MHVCTCVKIACGQLHQGITPTLTIRVAVAPPPVHTAKAGGAVGVSELGFTPLLPPGRVSRRALHSNMDNIYIYMCYKGKWLFYRGALYFLL